MPQANQQTRLPLTGNPAFSFNPIFKAFRPDGNHRISQLHSQAEVGAKKKLEFAFAMTFLAGLSIRRDNFPFTPISRYPEFAEKKKDQGN